MTASSAKKFEFLQKRSQEKYFRDMFKPRKNQSSSILSTSGYLDGNVSTSPSKFRVTIVSNKHAGEYSHYLESIRSPKNVDYSIEVGSEDPTQAVIQALNTEPFLIYLGCKYRETQISEDYTIDPARVISHKSKLLHRFFSIPEVEKFTEGETDCDIYDTMFDQLRLSRVRGLFSDLELALLDAYAKDHVKYKSLAMKLSDLYENYKNGLHLSLDEWRRLVDNEVRFGSIKVEKVNS